MNTITIPRKKIKEEGGVVVLSLEEYRRLYEKAIPTYYLEGKGAEKFDRMVEKGLKDYKEGKTISARSIDGALRIYAKKNKRS